MKRPSETRLVDEAYWENRRENAKGFLSKLKEIKNKSAKWSDNDLKEIVESVYLLNEQSLNMSLDIEKVEKIVSDRVADLDQELRDMGERLNDLESKISKLKSGRSFMERLFGRKVRDEGED